MKAHAPASTETLVVKFCRFGITVILHYFTAMAGDAMLLALAFFSTPRKIHSVSVKSISIFQPSTPCSPQDVLGEGPLNREGSHIFRSIAKRASLRH